MNEDRNAAIVEAVREGQSIGAVAREHGITRQRVSQIIHRAGLRFAKSRQAPLGHGIASRYGKGCRCELCRAANTARLKAYRAWKREQANG